MGWCCTAVDSTAWRCMAAWAGWYSRARSTWSTVLFFCFYFYIDGFYYYLALTIPAAHWSRIAVRSFCLVDSCYCNDRCIPRTSNMFATGMSWMISTTLYALVKGHFLKLDINNIPYFSVTKSSHIIASPLQSCLAHQQVSLLARTTLVALLMYTLSSLRLDLMLSTLTQVWLKLILHINGY